MLVGTGEILVCAGRHYYTCVQVRLFFIFWKTDNFYLYVLKNRITCVFVIQIKGVTGCCCRDCCTCVKRGVSASLCFHCLYYYSGLNFLIS